MPATMQIGSAQLTWTDEGCVTAYPDGATFSAQPHPAMPHYHVIAHRLGYGDDLLTYCREHEAVHHMVAEWIGGRPSDVLWPLAHGQEPDLALATMEEIAAQTFQRWLRANERPIIGGVDWDGLKARALALLPALP